MNTNDSNQSYRRYRQYRANREQYKVDQFAAPLIMILLIIIASNYWWVFLGMFAAYKIISNLTQKKPIEEKEKDIVNIDKSNVKESVKMNSTENGYVNKNNQKNIGKTSKPGTDHMQWFYSMECQDCGHIYLANGSDIWIRKCPNCQGGKK